MKVQLLLLGAVAILTIGALRLADPVPAASISAPPAAPPSIRESSEAPATEPVTAPATIVDTAPTPIAVVPEAVTAPSAAPEPVVGTVVCGTLSQVFQSLHEKRSMERPAIATICADSLPSSTEALRLEGDAGD